MVYLDYGISKERFNQMSEFLNNLYKALNLQLCRRIVLFGYCQKPEEKHNQLHRSAEKPLALVKNISSNVEGQYAKAKFL